MAERIKTILMQWPIPHTFRDHAIQKQVGEIRVHRIGIGPQSRFNSLLIFKLYSF